MKSGLPSHVGDVFRLHVKNGIRQTPSAKGVHQWQIVKSISDRWPFRYSNIHAIKFSRAVKCNHCSQPDAVAQRLKVFGSWKLWQSRFVPSALLGLDFGNQGMRSVTYPEQKSFLVVSWNFYSGLRIESPDCRCYSISGYYFLRIKDHQSFYHSHMRWLKKNVLVLKIIIGSLGLKILSIIKCQKKRKPNVLLKREENVKLKFRARTSTKSHFYQPYPTP